MVAPHTAPPPAILARTAHHVAWATATFLRQRFEGPQRVRNKGAIDLVTEADTAAESLIVAELARLHPDHACLAEEGGSSGPANAPVRWVVDPLDGTTNFAHGFPHFAVSVAAVAADGRVLAGAVADVMRHQVGVAHKGGGALLHHRGGVQALRVSGVAKLADALLGTGFPYDRASQVDNNHAEHDALSLASHGVRRPGAAALDLLYTAAGRLDGYWEAQLKPWDACAGALLVAEAGGVVSGYDGTAFVWDGHHVVASGPALHSGLLAALSATRSAQGLAPVPARR